MIAGVDEVGRGPLAGPVLAVAVVFDKRPRIKGLKDSKKMTHANRVVLSEIIKAQAVCWAIGIASVKEIDSINILQGSLLAMQRAILALPVRPDFALIDGTHCPKIALPMEPIVGGDDIVPAISAASIIAKVTRDYLMNFFDKRYPQYGFSQHKGYGTAQHLAALNKYGITPLHRQSFAPVKAQLADQL